MSGFRPNNTSVLGTRPRHLLDESAFSSPPNNDGSHPFAAQELKKRQQLAPSPSQALQLSKRAHVAHDTPSSMVLRASTPPRSTLIEDLVGRGGKIAELTKECEQLRQQVQRLEQKLRMKDDEKSLLQQDLQQYKALSSVQANNSQRDSDKLTTVLKAHVEKSSYLQAQLSDAKLRMEEMDKKIEEQRRELTNLTQQLAAKAVQIQQQKHEAKKELAKQVQCKDDTISQLQHELKLEKRDSAAERARNRDLHSRHEATLARCNELADTNAKLKVDMVKLETQHFLQKAAATTSGSVQSYEVTISVLREQLKEQEQQLNETHKWKEQATQYLVAKEELRISEQRCERLQNKLQAAQDSLAKVQELKSQLSAWRGAGQAHNIRTSEDMTAVIASLRQDKEKVIQQAESIRSELHHLQQQAAGSTLDSAGSKKDLQVLQEEVKASSAAAASAERRARVIQEERDGLRRLLASYQDADSTPTQLEAHHMAGKLAAMQDEVDVLLSKVEGAANLENELRKQLARATSEKEAIQADKQLLEREIVGYVQENEKLLARVGRGEYDAAQTKVLHFKYNPAAQLQESELLKLRAEVSALRQELEKLEGGDAAAGIVPLAEKQAEIVLLQRQVASTEKQMARLKEVFNVRISAFREACYALFGYRIDMVSQPTTMKEAATATSTFVLQPHLAQDSNAMLKFVYTKQGGMQMLPTPFSQQHQQHADFYIKRFKSIPAFTANLTLENFQKATES